MGTWELEEHVMPVMEQGVPVAPHHVLVQAEPVGMVEQKVRTTGVRELLAQGEPLGEQEAWEGILAVRVKGD